MPTLLDVFNDTAKLASTALSIADEKLMKQSELDQMHVKSQFNLDASNKLRELQANPEGYESWVTEIDSWCEKAMQSYTSNPTFSAYTIEQLQNYFYEARNSLQNQVAQMYQQRASERRVIDMGDTVSNFQKSTKGQNQVSEVDLAYHTAFQAGDIDESTYRKLTHNELSYATTENLSDVGGAAIEQAIKDGSGFEVVEAAIRGNLDRYQSNITGDTLTDVEYEDIQNSVIKSCQAIYNGKVSALQSKNSNALSEEYLNVMRLNGTQQYQAAQNALTVMKTQMSGLNLDESSRVSYTKLFSSIIDGWESEWAKDSGTGSSSSTSKVTLQSYEDFLAAAPDTYWAALTSGQFDDMYTAVNAAAKTLKDEWMYGNYKENSGLSEEERAYTFQQIYEGQISASFDKLLQQKFKSADVDLGAVYDSYIRLKDDVIKSGEDYDPVNLERLQAFMIDAVCETNPGDWQKIGEQAQKYINECVYTKTQSKLLFGTQSVKQAYSDKDISNYVDAVWNNDIFFTNTNGQVIQASGSDVTGALSALRYAVGQSLGLADTNAIELGGYQQTMHDQTTVPVITVGGLLYQVEPVTNDKGKVTGYQVFEVTGGAHNAVTAPASVDTRQAIREANAAEYAEQTDAARDAYQAKQEQETQRVQMYSEITEPPAAVKAYYGTIGASKWYQSTSQGNIDRVDAIIKDLDNGALFDGTGDKKTFTAIGFDSKAKAKDSREEWLTFTDEEKENLILGKTTLTAVRAAHK